jgi:hypothetical protein
MTLPSQLASPYAEPLDLPKKSRAGLVLALLAFLLCGGAAVWFFAFRDAGPTSAATPDKTGAPSVVAGATSAPSQALPVVTAPPSETVATSEPSAVVGPRPVPPPPALPFHRGVGVRTPHPPPTAAATSGHPKDPADDLSNPYR